MSAGERQTWMPTGKASSPAGVGGHAIPQLSALHFSRGGSNLFDPRPSVRPSPREQHNDGQTPAGQVLLVPNVLVGGYQQFVTLTLRNIQQFPVAQL